MDLSERIEGFVKLGEYLKDSLSGDADAGNFEGNGDFKDLGDFRDLGDFSDLADPGLHSVAEEARIENPWFTPAFISRALRETSTLLDRTLLWEWVSRYEQDAFRPAGPRVVGTILAGNIPLVGFHDFLSVLISGHVFRGKLSGKDNKLLPFLASKLQVFEPGFKQLIEFRENRIGTVDAMIATGSNNTSRYFEYYFGKYPHIFRKNRNGIALLDGSETDGDLSALTDDIFLYFGMGCRNVAKLYVPPGYSFDRLYKQCERHIHLIDHHKYANNYLYQRSVFLMNRVKHLDNGFLIIRQDPSISSPVATLNYEEYSRPGSLADEIAEKRDFIQCIVTGADSELSGRFDPAVPAGKSQSPALWDYADHVDTLNFLSNL